MWHENCNYTLSLFPNETASVAFTIRPIFLCLKCLNVTHRLYDWFLCMLIKWSEMRRNFVRKFYTELTTYVLSVKRGLMLAYLVRITWRTMDTWIREFQLFCLIDLASKWLISHPPSRASNGLPIYLRQVSTHSANKYYFYSVMYCVVVWTITHLLHACSS